MHLIELTAQPKDLGEVPHSTSANYAAAWTRDGRVWFTWDHSADGADQRWSYVPGDKQARGTRVPGVAAVDAVVALD
jgi:hypothetical protein